MGESCGRALWKSLANLIKLAVSLLLSPGALIRSALASVSLPQPLIDVKTYYAQHF